MEYRLPISMDSYASSLADRSFILDRLHAPERADPKLLSYASDPTSVRIVTSAAIPVEWVPRWLASRFRNGGPENKREEIWTLSDSLSAVITITSDRGPAFEGEASVVDCYGGSILTIAGAYTMRVPIIGKRVEALSQDCFMEALESDYHQLLASHMQGDAR